MEPGLLTVDAAGRIALFNRAAERLLDRRFEDVRDKRIEDLFPEISRVLREAGDADPESREERRVRESVRTGSGSEIHLALIPCRLPPTAGDPESGQVSLVFWDAGEVDEIERQLEHLDRIRSLDQFSAGIVHEIRNPLAGISTNAQLLLEMIGTNGEAAVGKSGQAGELVEVVGDILADVDQIDVIVSHVLNFAHPDRSQFCELSIAELITEVLKFSRKPLLLNGIQLETDFREPSAKVRVDVSRMRQVFYNILRNASEAMPDGGRIQVVAHPGGANDTIRIEVMDTGPGMPADVMDRVFDAFFSRRKEGTGLGLAISQKIVESHGGRIEVASVEGEGASFTVVLPVVRGVF